jgi:hypothetical protein
MCMVEKQEIALFNNGVSCYEYVVPISDIQVEY